MAVPRMIVVAVLLALARNASAESPTVRLETSDEAMRCLDVTKLRGDVEQILGRQPFREDSPIAIRIDGSASSLTVLLIREGHVQGRRDVPAADCATVTARVALVLATAISGLREEPLSPPAKPAAMRVHQAGDREPAPYEVAEARAPYEVAEARAPSYGVEALAGMAGGYSSADRLTGGVLVGARLGRGPASLGLELRFEPPRSSEVEGGGSVVTSSGIATLAPCARAGGLSACGLLSAGYILGRGEDLLDTRTVMTPHASTGARVGLMHGIGGAWALEGRVEGEIAFTNTILRVDEMPVWTSSRFDLRVGLAVARRLP